MPSEPIWLHPEAIREVRAAREWYSAWSDEVGDAFMAEVDSAIERIGEGPGQWPTYLGKTRRYLLRRFPLKQCILNLYRSAVKAGEEWEDDLRRVSTPGLVLWGEKDPYAVVEFGGRLAQKTRARFVSFPGCSHWWQLERPAEVAAELERHWTAL